MSDAPPDDETLAFAARVFQAAREGDTGTLAPLLAGGLPANLANDKGDTLLMLASYHGHAEAVRLLLAHGADPDRTNDRGQTPLAGTAFKGETAAARALLEGGAGVDAAGPDGRTPLMMAAMFDRTDMVALLLAHGADRGRRTPEGLDALGAARMMGARDTPALLDEGAEGGTPPLRLDHLAVIAPSLAEGVAHVEERLGVRMPAGGRHPEMGTHNHLLRLGEDLFLEVIAVDPDAPQPAQPRWFGLDDTGLVRAEWDASRRLRGWVARTGDLDAMLARHGALLGRPVSVSRGDRRWRFAVPEDGSLPAEGAPSVMDWGPRGNPAPDMPDLGIRLLRFRVEHPDPARIEALYRRLGVVDPPEIRLGARLRYTALLQTPWGVRELD